MKLVLSLVAMPALLVAQQATDAGFRPISLAEAVKLAQENSPTAIQARGAIENAEGTIRTTYNQMFPTVSSSLGHSQGAGQRLDPTTGKLVGTVSQPQYSTSLSANYTLFDGGKRQFDLKARKADLASAEVAESAAKFNIALQVKQQYYAILAAREAEAAALIALDLSNQQLAASTARVAAGAAIISDSLRSFVAVGNSQLALLTARNNVRNSSVSLTRLVGSPSLVTAIASDTGAFALTPIDSVALVAAAANSPTVQQSQAALNAANASVQSARTPFLPTISTSFRYGGSGYDIAYGIGGGRLLYSNSLSISASYPIWDGRNRNEALNRAHVTVTNAEASLRDAKLVAQQNILLQISSLRSAEERIRIQALSLQAAQEDLRVQQLRYSVGSSTLLEVTTSQNALNTARVAVIQARLDYRLARAQIEAIIGRDMQ